ncbi:NAD(P)H-dependent flavin oxidoreductase [Corynebacterium sp. A21]|uniref:NAD(P)H-dependent flavin oxidoreductase n=1 Tax=Corynebacterium sp. A21 TaxID=3457318 RepID=UPI003FD23DB2
MGILDGLKYPVIAAPMAGGPSTPALVMAVGAAGGLGFLAAGTISAARLSEDLAQLRGPYAVNLFARQEPLPDLAEVNRVREQLGVAELPEVDYRNGWEAKLQAVLNTRHRPLALSSTFGPLSAAEIASLQEAGIEAWVTVTNPADAATAVAAGADALVVQGPEAGGHRSTWQVPATPDERALPQLLDDVAKLGLGVPLIAAGGIGTPAQVAAYLGRAEVRAVSCGTAFLRATESGTSVANREILAGAPATVATRAFSGRVARGAITRYTREHPDTPPIYPYLNPLLAPRRSNPDFAYCLAGIGAAETRQAPAAEIFAELVQDLPGELTETTR